MIVCTVCHTENSHLTIVCRQCGAYLQTRIDTLDLFATMWNIIERPSKGFHKIAIAQHKNYTYVLSSAAGIGIAFIIFWLIKAAEYSDSLINLVGAAFVIGPLFGILLVQLLSFIEKLTMRAFKVTCRFRNIVAVTAYAFVPLVFSMILFLPIKLMTFGTYFFSRNPSPFTLRPTSYSVLLGMDALFTLWSAMLLAVGVKTLTNSGWIRTLSITAIAVLIVIILVTAVFRILLPL